jgi:hypothetical protein
MYYISLDLIFVTACTNRLLLFIMLCPIAEKDKLMKGCLTEANTLTEPVAAEASVHGLCGGVAAKGQTLRSDRDL